MKKVLSFVLAVVLIVTSLMSLTVSSAVYMIGDLDNDGTINGKDGNMLKRCIAGAAILDDIRCGDVDKNGIINGTDNNLLLQYLAGVYIIEQPEEEPETPDVPVLSKVEIQEYTVVYPENGSVYEQYAAEILCDYVKDNYAVELALTDDTATEVEYEILVGNTNRSESAVNIEFADNQYILKTDGKKLVLLGKDYMVGGAVGDLTHYCMSDGYVVVDTIPTVDTVLNYTPVEGDNVILMIGDGMGFNHIDFASLYTRVWWPEWNYEGFIAESFPNQGESITYCVQDMLGDYSFQRIITDSAASGTAMSTGWKTQRRKLGINRYDQEVKNVREMAHDLGYKTAVLSTEPSSGATPSAFLVHCPDRGDATTILAQQAELIANNEVTLIKGDINDNLLADTKDAIDLISTDSDGFFIMIEESYIDKASEKIPSGQYTYDDLAHYMVRFNSSIQYAATFTAATPGTVLIVTADHETGVMTSGGMISNGGNHSNLNVPIYAMGYGTEYFNGIAVENVKIGQFIADIYGYMGPTDDISGIVDNPY